MSKTAPVEKEQPGDVSQKVSSATSSGRTIRAIGTLARSFARRSSVRSPKIAVSDADGVIAFTSTPEVASSLPIDLVSAMTAAFDAT